MVCTIINDNSSRRIFNKGMETSYPNGHGLPLLNVITQHKELTQDVNSNDPVNIAENTQSNGYDITDAVSPMTVDMTCDIGSETTPDMCESQANFENNQHQMRVILEMEIGLVDQNNIMYKDYRSDSRFPLSKEKRKFLPTNDGLIKEIKRRKILFNDISKTNMQTKQEVAIKWLVNNPLTKEEDIIYIQSHMVKLTQLIAKAENQNKKSQPLQTWKGIIPHLRLIHCLVDFDSIKSAYLNSLNTLSRAELDGRKNSETKRQCPWELMSEKWMDPNFKPTSRVYPHLHDDFRIEIDLQHSLVQKNEYITG